MRLNFYYILSITIILSTILITLLARIQKHKSSEGFNMVVASVAISSLTYLLLSERVELVSDEEQNQ